MSRIEYIYLLITSSLDDPEQGIADGAYLDQLLFWLRSPGKEGSLGLLYQNRTSNVVRLAIPTQYKMKVSQLANEKLFSYFIDPFVESGLITSTVRREVEKSIVRVRGKEITLVEWIPIFFKTQAINQEDFVEEEWVLLNGYS